MRTILIGNPENRRVSMFQEALAKACQPPAEVVSYRDLVADPSRLGELDDGEAIVRQDSAGEDFEVEKGLLMLGYEDAVGQNVSVIEPDRIERLEFDRGRICCPRQHHMGFQSLLRSLEEVFVARPNWRVLQPTAGIDFLFDKRETSRRWQAGSIRVPTPLDSIASAADVRAAAVDHGSIYVKASCASSASCLAIYTRRGDREVLTTTIECAATGWYNSLRLSRYRGRERIDEVLHFLIGEGAQVEVAVPKARLGGHPFDLRLVVVAGEVAFGLVRQNRHAITNLHLGGWRGQWSDLETNVGAEVLARASDDAVAAANASGCFVVGVDVLIEADRKSHRVIEGNAFGDLLPGLERDGLSVYGWQIAKFDSL